MPKKSSVKNTKSSSKLAKTLAWFKPTSAKKGALLFAIAFAVIGGSYMAYQSFAQTLWVVQYPPDSVTCYGDCLKLNDTDSSKRTFPVVRISSSDGGIGSAGTAYSTFLFAYPWSAYKPTDKIPTRVCAELRSDNGHDSVARMKIILDGGRGSGDSGPFSVINWHDSNYTKFCMPAFGAPGSGYPGTPYKGTVSINSVGTGTSSYRIFVKSVSLESQ